MVAPKKVDFGYQRVDPDLKTRLVNDVFSSVSEKYDLMNDLMSGGLHRWWKNIAVQMSGIRKGQSVLDLAGGTGDMAMRFIPYLRNNNATGSVVAADINYAMLNHGRSRLLNKGFCEGITWVQADAQQLPFSDHTFDLVSIAFGLRNITDINKALNEMYRVLKKNGKLLILEFSHPQNPTINTLYQRYSFQLLPKLGQYIAGDEKSYRYLVESIQKHPKQEDLLNMLSVANFAQCEYHNLSAGIVAIHTGIKHG